MQEQIRGKKVEKIDIRTSTLVRCGFLSLLKEEFGICIRDSEVALAEHALSCITIFDTWQDFFCKTNWERDNPEAAGQDYLLENRICREIGGKIWYFSHILWEEWPFLEHVK